MRLDRRAVACALAFGHKAPYITIPFGFGLIFQRVIADNLSEKDVYKRQVQTGVFQQVAADDLAGNQLMTDMLVCDNQKDRKNDQNLSLIHISFLASSCLSAAISLLRVA